MNQEQPLGQSRDIRTIESRRNLIYSTGCFYELTKWVITGLVVLSLINFFAATIFIVDGISMEPNFHNGEVLIANRWQYLFGQPQRGDTVILKFPGDPEHKKYIKRIVGLPKENIIIKNSQVFINGRLLAESYIPAAFATQPNVNRTLREDEYFLMGDNRPNSNDSRVWGVAAKRFLIGRAWIEIYPKIKVIKSTKY